RRANRYPAAGLPAVSRAIPGAEAAPAPELAGGGDTTGGFVGGRERPKPVASRNRVGSRLVCITMAELAIPVLAPAPRPPLRIETAHVVGIGSPHQLHQLEPSGCRGMKGHGFRHACHPYLDLLASGRQAQPPDGARAS